MNHTNSAPGDPNNHHRLPPLMMMPNNFMGGPPPNQGTPQPPPFMYGMPLMPPQAMGHMPGQQP